MSYKDKLIKWTKIWRNLFGVKYVHKYIMCLRLALKYVEENLSNVQFKKNINKVILKRNSQFHGDGFPDSDSAVCSKHVG
jgi:hypothetical protein